jgi:hypothetical protein
MRELDLHFVPILVAALAKMALGALWYSPVLPALDPQDRNTRRAGKAGAPESTRGRLYRQFPCHSSGFTVSVGPEAADVPKAYSSPSSISWASSRSPPSTW